MGQAKLRGSREDRVAEAIYLQAESEAWAEYYRLERARLDAWFFYHLPVGQRRSITKKRVDNQLRFAAFAGFALSQQYHY